MRKVTTFIALALLLTLWAIPVYAQSVPPLPHAFYGSVSINGDLARVGTEVEARGTGVLTGTASNPVITTVVGIYGTSSPFEPRLIVQGNIDEGETIYFYIDGESTGQTAEWHSGETTQINLGVTIVAPPGGGGLGPLPSTIETTLFGVEGEFLIDADGEIQETVTATSADGKLTITIEEGTTALDKDGNPLSGLEADVDPSPPDPPEDASIIGLVYDFGPEGATFDPPITLEFTYDPDDIPGDVAEEDLVIVHYDEDADEWVDCPCTCDTKTNCVTASIEHFTTFAIIARAAPPPVVAPAPPPVVAPAPPAPPAPPVAPPVAPPPAPLPEVEPAINWWLIGGLTAAVVIAILLVYFLWVRRRAY